MRKQTPRSQEVGARGFTLVELVAAVALFGILMVALVRVTVVLHGTARAAETAATVAAAPQAWERRAAALLAGDFDSAAAEEHPSPAGPLRLVCSAATLPPAAVSNQRGVPPAVPPAEPARVVWRFVEPPAGSPAAGGRLVREVTPLLDRDARSPLLQTVAWGVLSVRWETPEASPADGPPSEPRGGAVRGVRLRLELVGERSGPAAAGDAGREPRVVVLEAGDLSGPSDAFDGGRR